jgi:hypothetical protein
MVKCWAMEHKPSFLKLVKQKNIVVLNIIVRFVLVYQCRDIKEIIRNYTNGTISNIS